MLTDSQRGLFYGITTMLSGVGCAVLVGYLLGGVM